MTSSGPPTWQEGGNGSDSNSLSEPGELATHGRVWGLDSGCVAVTMSTCVYVKGRWKKPASQWDIRTISCEKGLWVWSPQGSDITSLAVEHTELGTLVARHPHSR